jgi:hypothetical protein
MATDDLGYFEIDGPVSDEERAFLSAIRRHTQGRLDLWGRREGSASGPVLVGIHVDAPSVALITAGVRVQLGHLHGDRLDDQSYDFADPPSSLAIDVVGSPEELAAAATTWFGDLERRTIVRHEWVHKGRIYAHCYVFADTKEPLAQMYRRDWAPFGQAWRLRRGGHVFGRGWIQTSGLGRPDRVTPVRP